MQTNKEIRQVSGIEAAAAMVVTEAIRRGMNNASVNPYSAMLVEKLSGPLRYKDPSDVAELRWMIKIYDDAKRVDAIVDIIRPYRPQPDEKSGIQGWPIKTKLVCMETMIPLCLKPEHYVRGVGVGACLGAGKSTAAAHLIDPLLDLGVPVIIFDRKNDHEYDFVQNRHPVLILTVGKDFFFNPFDGGFSEVIAIVRIIMEVSSRQDSRVLSEEAVRQFFESAGSAGGATLTFAQWQRMIAGMRTLPGERGFKPVHWQSLAVVTTDIRDSALGHAFHCLHGIDIGAMLRKGISLLLHTHDLSRLHEEMLICTVAEKVYRSAETDSNLPVRGGICAVLVVDESTPYVTSKLDREQRYLGPLASFCLNARGRRIVVMLCFHNPSEVSKAIQANFHVQLWGHTISEADLKAIKESCSLTLEQMQQLSHSGVGQFVCKLGSDYTRPFFVESPPLVRLPVPQTIIEQRNRDLLAQLPPIVPEPELVPKVKATVIPKNDMETLKMAILKDCHANKFVGVADRFKAFEHNGTRVAIKKGNAVLEELEKEGLCESIAIKLHKKSAATKFYVPTEKGYKTIGSPPDRLIPRGGTRIAHRFCQEFIVRRILNDQGIKAKVEPFRNGKQVDVAFEHNRLAICMEVAQSTSGEHEAKQARADLEAGYDSVTVIFPDRKSKERAVPFFISEFGLSAKYNVVLAEFWHIATYPVAIVYNHPEMVFAAPKDDAGRKGKTA